MWYICRNLSASVRVFWCFPIFRLSFIFPLRFFSFIYLFVVFLFIHFFKIKFWIFWTSYPIFFRTLSFLPILIVRTCKHTHTHTYIKFSGSRLMRNDQTKYVKIISTELFVLLLFRLFHCLWRVHKSTIMRMEFGFETISNGDQIQFEI